MGNKFLISVYCGPQPPIEVDGIKYPNKIVKDQYQLLKDLGINTIYGQCDIMNTETEEYAFRALTICCELEIDYFVKDLIAREYCSLGEKMFKKYQFKDFRKLTESEKKELDERFKSSILRYGKYKSFKGIIFVDEPGMEMFEGISRACEVFKSVYPDKIFLVNHYPYNTNQRDYQFSVWQDNGKDPLRKELEFKLDKNKASYDGFYMHNNVEKYEFFINDFFSRVDTNVFSYDLYPFRDWYGYETLVMRGIYEMPLIANELCKKYNLEYWQFLQCGGLWDDHAKVTTFADVQLSVSLAMALGAKGMQLYTGCFPNDCLPRVKEISGVIDEYGNITNQYNFYRYAFRQAKAIECYLVPAVLKKVILDGEYYDKTPDVEGLKALDVSDIYKGKFPIYGNYETRQYNELVSVESDYQVLVSCFELNGKSLFMVVNTSPLITSSAKLNFDKERELVIIQGGCTFKINTKSFKIRNLPAGENLLIICN